MTGNKTGNAIALVPSFSDALKELPDFVRKDLFRTKIRYPGAFLSSVAKSAPHIFREVAPEEAEEIWDDIKDQFSTLARYAEDFFPKDSKNEIQVSDETYEVFGFLCNGHDQAERSAPLSKKGQEILEQINKLRWDPYPRQADYAGNEARFLFLLMNLINSFTYASFYAATPKPREDAALFYYGFQLPMRTLNPEASKLEHDILQNVKRIEFMLDFEDHPYFSHHLNILRQSKKSTLTAQELLEKLGLPVTDNMANTIILANYEFADFGMIDTDKTLAMMLSSYAHTKLLMEADPDRNPDILAFSMLLPSMNSPYWKQHKEEWFGEQRTESYEYWYNWIIVGNKPQKPFPKKIREALSNVRAAWDIVELERISLLFQQHGKDPTPISYEDSLIEAKASLMQIRETAQTIRAANIHLQKLRTSMMYSAFAEMHALSEYYPALQQMMNVAEGTPIYDDAEP
jgi:hypothetical protein